MDSALTGLQTLDQLQIAIAFLLYAFLFGWIGYQRGAAREWWVLGVAATALVVLRLQGSIFVRIANLGWRLVQLLMAGGLSEDGASTSTGTGTATRLITTCPDPQTVPATPCNESAYLFLLWVAVVIFAYVATTVWIKKSPRNGWAIVAGLGSGLLYASVFLPRLLVLFRPDVVEFDQPIILATLVTLLRTAFSLIWNIFRSFWVAVGSAQPFVILLILIVLVVGAASTLRGAKK